LDRERRPAERRLEAAKFPGPKTLETFDFKARPSVNKLLVLERMHCEYLDKRENVLLAGNSGTGKTHLATALAMEACSRGKRVRFFRVTELITQLMEAREKRQLARMRSGGVAERGMKARTGPKWAAKRGVTRTTLGWRVE
jgi:DNA replication protein DnaC